MKIAAFIGNHHLSFRVTPFFDTHQEAKAAAVNLGYKDSWNRTIANLQEHQEWNKARAGMYKEHPVIE